VGSEQYARRQSQQAGEQRTQTLVAQFQRELAQRSDEVVRAVQSVADSEATLRMALDLTRPQADPSVYANDAHGLANIYHLDFLELAAGDGTLISSSHWAPTSGYRNDWVASESDWNHQGAFLSRVQLPDNVELGLLAVRTVRVGERNLYVIGGWRFDREFLRTMALPEGMRALLYASLEPGFIPEALSGPEGAVAQPELFAPLVESLQRGQAPQTQTIPSADQSGAETFVSVPLQGRGGELLGALLVGNSQRDLAALVNTIRSLAMLAAGIGVLFSLALSWWISARVSKPLAQLADAARELQSGKWTNRPELRVRGETAPVAAALNDLSGQLSRDRERIVQRERAAARREMARRFARDLKESIFPLHMAAEDMVNAREETSERFDEIFFESTTAMRAELDRLKGIAARFGEFGRMTRPRPGPVNVNEIARAALKALEPQFHAAGRPPVTPEVHLGEPEPVIEADPDQLRAALENLLLHCLEAMPSGGTLAIRTRESDAAVRIEVAAKGASLNTEDCQRLFVPTGATPEGMTGLGLATTQAVVADHGGRISAESAPDSGATFRLEFPAAAAGNARPVWKETARQAPQAPENATQQAPAEIPAPAAQVVATQPAPEPPAATAPSEPVHVTIVTVEETSVPAETESTAEQAGQADQPGEPARPFRGLTYTE
jgi:signal transduction histidine kinase